MKNVFTKSSALLLATLVVCSCGKKTSGEKTAVNVDVESMASRAPHVINLEQLKDAQGFLNGEWSSKNCRSVSDIELAKAVSREYMKFEFVDAVDENSEPVNVVSFREIGFKDDKCVEKNASTYWAERMTVRIDKELSDVVSVKDTNDHRVYLVSWIGKDIASGWLRTKFALVAFPSKTLRAANATDTRYFYMTSPVDKAEQLPDVVDPATAMKFEPVK